jgi:hypothetical protein
MRSRLALRSPNQGYGWGEPWTFTGRDERILRDCLAALDEFATHAPGEHWDWKTQRNVIHAGDRSLAVMLLYPVEAKEDIHSPVQPEAAWTADGALRLADLLPDAFDDLRQAILRRFA